jgi:hypothetical protein
MTKARINFQMATAKRWLIEPQLRVANERQPTVAIKMASASATYFAELGFNHNAITSTMR